MPSTLKDQISANLFAFIKAQAPGEATNQEKGKREQ
jgi:hypothetical protein